MARYAGQFLAGQILAAAGGVAVEARIEQGVGQVGLDAVIEALLHGQLHTLAGRLPRVDEGAAAGNGLVWAGDDLVLHATVEQGQVQPGLLVAQFEAHFGIA